VDDRSTLLQELIDVEDIDRLIEIVTLDEIATAWCRYSSLRHSVDDDDPDWWAIELFMTSEIFKRTALYRALLLKLVEHAQSDGVIGAVGAGPLENFVSDDQDDLMWLESECQFNEKLRRALGGVWCAGEVSAETLERLDAAAGTQLARPRPREEWSPALRAAEDAHAHRLRIGGLDMVAFENPTPEQERALEAFVAAEDRWHQELSKEGPSGEN
jgi:hypothetical protein